MANMSHKRDRVWLKNSVGEKTLVVLEAEMGNERTPEKDKQNAAGEREVAGFKKIYDPRHLIFTR